MISKSIVNSPRSATWFLIGLSTLVHLVISPQFELGADEAHYALYGVFLDWSYFDHPPMIGWLQALALTVSKSELALRAIPIFLFGATSLALYGLVSDLYPNDSPWLPFFSVAIVHSGLMFQLIGLTMLPDAPLLFVSVMAVKSLHRLFQQQSLKEWLWFGAWLGLAGLSKYTAVTLVLSSILLVTFNRRFDLIRGIGIWAATVVSLILITPVLYWNYTHDWISFLYQIKHGTEGAQWHISKVLVSQIIQLLLYSPGIYLLGIIAAVATIRSRLSIGDQFTVLFALPVLVLFAWNSGYEETLPHWPAFGWLMLAPVTARFLNRKWDKRWTRVVTRLSLAYSVILILAVQSQFFYPWMPFPDNQNLVQDLHGWRQATSRALELKKAVEQETGEEAKLFVTSWPFASRLAWNSHPVPVIVADQRQDQFDIWYGQPANGDNGILVLPAYSKKIPPKTGEKGQFKQCTDRGILPIRIASRIITTYHFFACEEFMTGNNP